MDQSTNINNPPDITDHKIRITFFKDQFAASLITEDMTLQELGERILNTAAATKNALPWLKGARFGAKKKPKSSGKDPTSLRWDGNVTGVDLIELDYDQEVMSLDEAVATINAMNVRALIYTTPSHTKNAPRWRLLLPTSSQLRPEMRAKLCARVNGRFGNIFASESFVLSQSYYFGLARNNTAPDHRVEIIDGRMIDQCIDDLYRFEACGYPHHDRFECPRIAGTWPSGLCRSAHWVDAGFIETKLNG
jgi:hypothetical protein